MNDTLRLLCDKFYTTLPMSKAEQGSGTVLPGRNSTACWSGSSLPVYFF